MKTYFSKAEQKWVSEIPSAYWLGVYDERTGEKIYSDEAIYDTKIKHHKYPFPIQNAKEFYVQYGVTPGVIQSGHYVKSNTNPKWHLIY